MVICSKRQTWRGFIITLACGSKGPSPKVRIFTASFITGSISLPFYLLLQLLVTITLYYFYACLRLNKLCQFLEAAVLSSRAYMISVDLHAVFFYRR